MLVAARNNFLARGLDSDAPYPVILDRSTMNVLGLRDNPILPIQTRVADELVT